MWRAAVAWALIGCGSSAPPPPSPTPLEAAAPAVPDLDLIVVSEPAEPTAQELLEREEAMYWLVPQPGGDAFCRPFAASPAGSGRRGFIEPVDEDPDEQWRVTFEYRYGDTRVELSSPRGMIGDEAALLANCVAVFEASELPWFAARSACEEAAGSQQPLDLGACAAAVLGFPRVDQAPDRLSSVLSRGGRIHALEQGPDGPSCREWRFIPPSARQSDGRMIHTSRQGNSRSRVTYQYSHVDRILTLAGPSSENWVDGRSTGGFGMPCAEIHYVHHPSGEFASVGGVRWYYRAAECERALEEPGASAASGGC